MVEKCSECPYASNGIKWHCHGAPVMPLTITRIGRILAPDRVGHYTTESPVISPNRPACFIPHMMGKLEEILEAIPGAPIP